MDPDHGKCWGTDKVTMKDTFSTREPEESSRSASWDEYYAWGQHQIAKSVSFLNNDCKWIPGNVCLTSAVVTQNLDQKPHAFDVLSDLMTITKLLLNPCCNMNGLMWFHLILFWIVVSKTMFWNCHCWYLNSREATPDLWPWTARVGLAESAGMASDESP